MQYKVFAQLYSLVRQEREGHIDALRQISEIGYDGVELLGYNTNGLTIEEYRSLLKELHLAAISSTLTAFSLQLTSSSLRSAR